MTTTPALFADDQTILSAPDTRALVVRALREDLADTGDVTSEVTVPEGARGIADLVARRGGVVAGLGLIAVVFAEVDPGVEVSLDCADGDEIVAGQVVASVAGPLRSVLAGERTALNLVNHLSGVATATRRFVDEIAGTDCVVRDTRKTTPGLRMLEKAAVRAGGGVNHRIGLFDGVLVKDNHVAATGAFSPVAAAALSAAAARGLVVQLEVDSMEELDEALALDARDILLDNFTPEQTAEAVRVVRAHEQAHGGIRVLLESSGTITLDTVRAYALAGVDRVSVGAITHSAANLDIGLDLRVEPDTD